MLLMMISLPQTKEAISHASGWSSYYFAINKVDKPMQIQRKLKRS
jgi:hypothetical protein